MRSFITTRILLLLLLIFGILFPIVFPSVHADTTSSAPVLSPAIAAKLDAFIAKVQAKRSRYSSDENWGMFIDNLSRKIVALKPRYVENPLILAVLDRLNSGVTGLRNISASASLMDNEDLCAKEGLDNIDETNFSTERNIIKWDNSRQLSFRYKDNFAYKMDAGQSYSFPVSNDTGDVVTSDGKTTTVSRTLLNKSPYLNSAPHIFNISKRKCDFKPTNNSCYMANPGGSDYPTIYIGIHAKYADPNYKERDFATCHLTPTKPGEQYYINIRWARKSDNITSITSFNSKWDACVSGTQNICALDYYSTGQDASPKMLKFTPQIQQQVSAAQDAAAQANRSRIEEETQQRNNPKVLPVCGNDWATIGSFECRNGVQYQIITSCNPSGTDYRWSLLNAYTGTWQRISGGACSSSSGGGTTTTNTVETQNVGGIVNMIPSVPQCQSEGSSATLQWKCGCTGSPGTGWVLQNNGCYHHSL